jgi:hypothetical protein
MKQNSALAVVSNVKYAMHGASPRKCFAVTQGYSFKFFETTVVQYRPL